MGKMIYQFRSGNIIGYVFDNDGLYNILINHKIINEDGTHFIKDINFYRTDVPNLLEVIIDLSNFLDRRENDYVGK